MKIVDCFMFYNELDILHIRLHELYEIVDYFILVEATKTHTGKDKPLYYSENKERFCKYNDKIIHVITDFNENYDFSSYIDTPTVDWYRENYQRECIQVALKDLNLRDDDIIVLSDLDEIPNKRILNIIKTHDFIINNNSIYSFEMTLYYYNIELTTPRKWYYSKLFTNFTYKQNKLLTTIRIMEVTYVICDGGWHLSYFGDEHFIKNKVESFAESTEYKEDKKRIEYLKLCLDNNILHFNNEKLIYVPLSENNNVPSYFMQ